MRSTVCALTLLLALPGCASRPVVQRGLPSVPAWVMERPEDLQALLDQLVTPTSTPLPSRPTSR